MKKRLKNYTNIFFIVVIIALTTSIFFISNINEYKNIKNIENTQTIKLKSDYSNFLNKLLTRIFKSPIIEEDIIDETNSSINIAISQNLTLDENISNETQINQNINGIESQPPLPFALASPSIDFIPPTPENNSILINPNITINISVTSANPIDKFILNMNNIIYELPSLLSCSFEGSFICDDTNDIPANSSLLYFKTGKYGQGVSIYPIGNLTYISLGNIDNLTGTIMFWVKPTIGNSPVGTLFDSVGAYWRGIKLGLTTAPSPPPYYFYFNIGTTGTGSMSDIYFYNSSPPYYEFNTSYWTHAAFVYNKISSSSRYNISIYINGEFKLSRLSQAGDLAFNNYLFIGQISSFIFTERFNGTIDELKIFKKNLSDTEINSIYNKEFGSYYIKFNDLPDNNYNIQATTTDSLGNINVSETRTFTINTPSDMQYPEYSNIINSSITTYVKNGAYYFNITWNDNVALDNVWIEHNFQGTIRNTSVSLSGSQYSFLVNDIAADTYSYRWYANDTVGNINRTELINYDLSKASPICSMTMIPRPNLEYPTSVNVTGTCAPSEINSNLHRDGILVNNEAGMYVSLAAGVYDYLLNVSNTQNYSFANISNTITVNKGAERVSLFLNNVQDNLSLPFGNLLNATVNSYSGNFNLFRNGTDVTNEIGLTTNLTVGYYEYKANSTGNENYTSDNDGMRFYVNITSPQCVYDCNFVLNLQRGLNLVSIPFVYEDNRINVILEPILTNIKRVYGYNPINQWRVFNPNNSFSSSLNNFEPKSAYFIISNDSISLPLTGNLSYPDGTRPSKNLPLGWNLISINDISSVTIKDELENINYSSVWEFNNSNEYNEITNYNSVFKPGIGYWVNVTT